ncbi:ROK family transcriptional regulator [Streptomyces sp. SLBN-118]|uniref:ROK family transcriptional regulator n=1 Tax=Streptomyces sp. SLBN-118 TaxID=2768454 RepID=UPI00114F411B|nr:ROK family transcriptional regulator [Streptomyces sp. SLBN-118]
MNRTINGANLPVLRSHNASLVLDLLRTAGELGISRMELADRTGLTPQAVSKITARLREAGLAAEAGRRASTGGRPGTALRLVPSAGHAVGLHLDRDEMTAILLDLSGTPVAVRTAPLDLGAGSEAVVERVAGEVEALDPAGRRVLGVGVAMPGPLDHATGVTHRVTGFPEWDGFPLRDALAARLGLAVVLDKDTNAAALALALRGAGESFAYLHLGTGLGAGLVLGGALYRGARTGAGEFGHQVIELDGPQCVCGKRGCIEALCLQAVGRGELDRAAGVLGIGAANLVELLDIDRVLLGGRVVVDDAGSFVPGVGQRVGIPVALAEGGAHVVAEGAAQLVLAPLFGRAEVELTAPKIG